MVTNPFFENHGIEQEMRLFNDLIIESIQISGVDVKYLSRKVLNEDSVLNEELMSTFVESSVIEMFLEEVDGFSPNSFLVEKLGLSIADSTSYLLVVAAERFKAETGNEFPEEGDLLFIPVSDLILEIKKVDTHSPFHGRGKPIYFILHVEEFKFSHENIDDQIISDFTGVPNEFRNVFKDEPDPDLSDGPILGNEDLFEDNYEIEKEAFEILVDEK